MTGDGWPAGTAYLGNAGDNGEGTYLVKVGALTAKKSRDRISSNPGYYDFGTLGLAPNGIAPTLLAPGDAPLLFQSNPQPLNAAQEDLQAQSYRGISVAFSGGKPVLPDNSGIQLNPLGGMGAYSGAPFGFVFESKSSIWIADAGPGAQGGPGWPGVTGGNCSIGTCPPPIPLGQWAVNAFPAGLWDKYSCTIQHWTSTADILTGAWSWKESVIVDWGMPCYSLAGQVVNGVFTLFTSTGGNDYSGRQPGTYPNAAQPLNASALPQTGVWYSGGNGGYSAGPSKVYSVNTATKAVKLIRTAPANTVYRSVAIPPQPRFNGSACPPGYSGLPTNSSVCAFGPTCVAPCKPCPLGTYSSIIGAAVCTTCPSGTYTAQVGGSSVSSCSVCAPGYRGIELSAGSSAGCSQCPAGTSSLANSSACTACPAGTYAPTAGMAACTPCALGLTTTNLVTGSTSPAACTICAAGYSGPNPATSADCCVICPVGSYADTAGSTSCTTCQRGTWTAGPGSVNASACAICSPGFFGYVSYGIDASSGCATTGCQICPAGNYASAGATACVLCPPGTVAGASGSSSCTSCPANTYSPGSTVTSPALACKNCTTDFGAGFTSGPGSSYCSAPSGLASTAGFRAPGMSILGLRVGAGGQGQSSQLRSGIATALFIDEISTATGAVLRTIPVPSVGSLPGFNLAATLSTGMYASSGWDYKQGGFDPAYCRCASAGQPGLISAADVMNATAICTALCGSAAVSPANSYWNATWNKDVVGGGHGDGVYPLLYFDREGLMAQSYDGRFVTFPAYSTAAGNKIKLGAWFEQNPSLPAATEYDDKTVVVLSFDGTINTITRTPGSGSGNYPCFGPLIPDEPQYFSSAVTTGAGYPSSMLLYEGCAADYSGTYAMTFSDATGLSSSRLSLAPGFYDFGTLGIYTNGVAPTISTVGDAPLLFVSSPQVLNAGAENLQHQSLGGISYATTQLVAGALLDMSVPALISYTTLTGFAGQYSGHPFGFVFESKSSIWIADAGPGAQGGPGWPGVTGGTCSIGACPPPIPNGLWPPGQAPAGLWDKCVLTAARAHATHS